MNVHRRKRTKISEMRRRIYLRIPRWVRARDFELLITLLCLVGGIPLLTTGQVEAGSVESALPWYGVTIWGLVLVVGATMNAVGIWRIGVSGSRVAFPWTRVRASGLLLLAYAGYFYTVAASVTYYAQNDALPFGAFIFLAFALTAHSRSADVIIGLENFLDRLAEAVEELNADS